MGISEREVCKVVGHGLAFGDAVEAEIADAEVLRRHHAVCNVLQRVAFGLCGKAFEGFIHRHVGVEGVVHRDGAFLAVGIIDRGVEFNFFGQEASGLDVCGDGVFAQVVVASLAEGFFQSAEAVCLHVSGKGYRSEVRKLEVELCPCRPSALVGEFL